MAAVAEALALGVKLGLDPKLLSDIFNSSSARCWSSDTYNPCPVQVVRHMLNTLRTEETIVCNDVLIVPVLMSLNCASLLHCSMHLPVQLVQKCIGHCKLCAAHLLLQSAQNAYVAANTLQGVMDGVPASKEYKGGFATKLMLKDLGLAEAAAQHCNASVPMSAQAAKLYQQVICLPTGSLHALADAVTVCASVALLSVSTESALSSAVGVLSDADLGLLHCLQALFDGLCDCDSGPSIIQRCLATGH